jgi:hypothetical protein
VVHPESRKRRHRTRASNVTQTSHPRAARHCAGLNDGQVSHQRPVGALGPGDTTATGHSFDRCNSHTGPGGQEALIGATTTLMEHRQAVQTVVVLPSVSNMAQTCGTLFTVAVKLCLTPA